MAKKSLMIAYILWGLGGWFGLHHFYLGRDRQAFIWWVLVAGYGGGGWIIDFFRIPRYVDEANYDQKYISYIMQQTKTHKKPGFSLYRFIGQITFGNLLAWLAYSAIPIEEVIPGLSLKWLLVLVPVASAIGVHAVGNIGKEEGPIRNAMIGAYLPFVFYSMRDPKYYWSSIFAACAFRTQVKWRRAPPKPKGMCKRITILSACGLLYLSLWSSYLYFNMVITNEHGETIKFRDSVRNLIKSQMFLELRESVTRLWHYYKVHGWSTLWTEIITTLDPLGERNALYLMELPSGSSQEQITQKWRQLSRQWHPDKFRDPEEKAEAQAKFMEIKEAYDKLSVIHNKRKRQNSRSRTSESQQETATEEDNRDEL